MADMIRESLADLVDINLLHDLLGDTNIIPPDFKLLLETGDHILLETDDYILLE